MLTEMISSDTVFKFRRYRESLLNMALRILSYSIAAITLRLKRFFWWCPSSRQQLDDAERRVLSSMTRPYHGFFVDVGGVGEREERDRRSRIWTVMVDPDGDCKDPGLPLVLVHGYLCGSALWVLNLESFAKDRIVYSIDLPGFGKSSRPKLSKDAALAEEQLAQALEAWREAMGLERFVLLGHSVGAFVASAYTLRYPCHVSHLIVEDPWGLTGAREPDSPFELWFSIIAFFTRTIKFITRLDVCLVIQIGGILGPPFVSLVLTHETNMFSKIVRDETAISNYFYHCNVRRASGEWWVKSLMQHFPWPRHPMGPRLTMLPPEVGLTFVYGEHSFMSPNPAAAVIEARQQSYVKIHVLKDCGHNLHYEKPDEFSQVVSRACKIADEADHQ